MSSDPDKFLWRLQNIDEYEFERFVADLWELLGWETEVTPEGDDGGIDIVARKSSPVPQKQVIQVKRYSPDNSVGRPDIQQYSSLRYEDNVDAVVMVTTGQFTEGAQEVAKKHNVKLIDGQRLCGLIDTPDRRQLVESYLTESERQKYTDLTPRPEASPSEGSQLMNTVGEDVSTDEVPETIPGILKLRHEIISDIRTVESRFEEAEEAYNSQDFYTSFEAYIDVLTKRAELNLAIKRYDAGLAQVDQDTTQHLATPDTFITRLDEHSSELNDHYLETFQIVERARGLEVLSKEIDSRLVNVRRWVERGDGKKSRGKVEKARDKYIEAENNLQKIEETVRLYEELLNIYDEKVTNTHKISSGIDSYEELKSDVVSKIETVGDSKSRDTIAEEALGGFAPKILTGTGVRLSEQEIIDYIRKDEELNFVFVHNNKGFRIISADGEETTPDHNIRRNRVLLVTDRRVLYIAPMASHDKTLEFEYERITDATASTGLTSRTLEFTTDDRVKYRFADSGDHRDDLEPAADYIRSRING